MDQNLPASLNGCCQIQNLKMGKNEGSFDVKRGAIWRLDSDDSGEILERSSWRELNKRSAYQALTREIEHVFYLQQLQFHQRSFFL